MANAIADQLLSSGIDVIQDHVVNVLISYNKHVGPVWPDNYDNFPEPIITMDRRTNKWISVRIKTVREVKNHEVDTSAERYVLAYYSRKERNENGREKWAGYHCVFVKAKLELQDDAYECVNSWGDLDKFPVVESDRPENRLWVVRAEWEKAPEGLYNKVARFYTLKFLYCIKVINTLSFLPKHTNW